MLHSPFCFFFSPPSKVPDKTKNQQKSWPTEGACLFNVQLCIAGKAAELFPGEFHTGVDSNSCKPTDLWFMVKQLSFVSCKYISQ